MVVCLLSFQSQAGGGATLSRLYDVLDFLKSCCDAIAACFGDQCEVVVHDLRRPGHTIVHIANGHVTGREVGDSMQSSFMESLMRTRETSESFANYLFTTDQGRLLRATSVILRDESDEPIGALSINYDVTDLRMAVDTVSKLFNIAPPALPRAFPNDFNQVLEVFLDEAVQSVGRPVAYMTREEKIQVVGYLNRRGAFQLRDSVARVAAFLGVSRYTVYNYIEEARVTASKLVASIAS